MAKDKQVLIIIESPNKIKAFQKYLPKNYTTIASVGHVIDLPENELGVDIKNNFKPTFVVNDDKKDVLNNIVHHAKKADEIIMMTDLDREGSGIAWNIYNEIKDKIHAPVKRAVTNEITKDGILNAIKNAGEFNLHAVDAFLARRILDRLCGYKCSYLTKSATGGTSAGRVQSAILRVICEREKQIKNFKPEEYWIISATFKTKNGEEYVGYLSDDVKVKNEKEATEIYDKIVNKIGKVSDIEVKTINTKPYPPFVTMRLIAASSGICGFNAKKTMNIAQSIFAAGHITYHRTDSPFISENAMEMIRSEASGKFGSNYVTDNPVKYAAKAGSQEAHEAIRPTVANLVVGISDDDERKLYEMIYRGTVASQMKEAQDERTKIITTVNNYQFISRGNKTIFDGFRKCWIYSKVEQVSLPKLEINDNCTIIKIDKEQKFTSPPLRYSDASLSKMCEAEQIARPATFANFIETLKNRKYIIQKNKSFEATELGMKVTDFLVSSKFSFVDLKFTANMELLLDKIEDAVTNKDIVLSEFWEQLKIDIENAKKYKQDSQKTNFVCPKCNGQLLLKYSKFGPFFSCSNYKPKSKSKKKKETKTDVVEGCNYIANIDKDGNPVEKQKAAEKEYAPFECKLCHSKMVKRKGKNGVEFYGCEKYFATKCCCTADLDGNFIEKKPKSKWNKKKSKNNDAT